jgi:oligoribonuclease NrnB/cAMP/cGMP phosphodiesterase (DHH superfamily)
MICIYHSKDLDGICSGAIVQRKYPDAKMIGWDYGEPIPGILDFAGEEDVIMIDVTFPMDMIKNLVHMVKNLTIIDHHIGFLKDYLAAFDPTLKDNAESITSNWTLDTASGFTYIYEKGIAACEIGWKYLFPNEQLPEAVKLLSMYDTWRQNEIEYDWKDHILPFQYGTRLVCNSLDNFPKWYLSTEAKGDMEVYEVITEGKLIIKYQDTENEKICRNAFPQEFKGLRAICVNTTNFSSNTFNPVWDEEKYDIMIPFAYFGNDLCKASLYTTKPDIDCSALAKSKGGGGHRMAAGFETHSFDEIFK